MHALSRYIKIAVEVPRDIAFETKYLERESIEPSIERNLVSPGFPDDMSENPQYFVCTFTRYDKYDNICVTSKLSFKMAFLY